MIAFFYAWHWIWRLVLFGNGFLQRFRCRKIRINCSEDRNTADFSSSEVKNHRVIFHYFDWSIDWLRDWCPAIKNIWSFDRLIDWLFSYSQYLYWSTDSLIANSGWFIDRQSFCSTVDWLIYLQLGTFFLLADSKWAVDWSIDWLVDWSIDRSIDWLIVRSIDWSIDRSIDWLIDRSIEWVRYWLIDWLVEFILEHFWLFSQTLTSFHSWKLYTMNQTRIWE